MIDKERKKRKWSNRFSKNKFSNLNPKSSKNYQSQSAKIAHKGIPQSTTCLPTFQQLSDSSLSMYIQRVIWLSFPLLNKEKVLRLKVNSSP